LRSKAALRRRLARLRGGTFHMEMHCIPENRIREILSGQPVRIVDVKFTNSSAPSFNGKLEFLDREPDRGFVSKQYCLIKERSAAALHNQRPAEAGAGS
jgi:hypothetical protein